MRTLSADWPRHPWVLLRSAWHAASMQVSSSAVVDLACSFQSVVGKQRRPLVLRHDDLLVLYGPDIVGLLCWRRRRRWLSDKTRPDGSQDEQTKRA